MSRSQWARRSGVGALATILATGGLAVLAPPAATATGFTFTRLSGANRFGTAQAIASATFPSAPSVLIARADLFPDALAGSYLAGSTGSGAPILLTDTNFLPPETESALSSLGTNRATLLGGTAAISANVENQLRARNITVDRIAGSDRFDTARKVAERPGAANVGAVDGQKAAIVASGRNFPDALAGGPLSYAGKLPTILSEPSSLPAASRQALTGLGIRQVLLLGGPAAVGDNVETEIRNLGITVTRLSGANRQATAVEIARTAATKLGFPRSHASLARGDAFADALALGAHAGKESSPVLLTGAPDVLSTDTRRYLEDNRSTLTAGHIAGGDAAVNPAVASEATTAATNGRATLAVTNTTIQAGNAVSGTLTGDAISGATASGCGLTDATVSRDAQGAFSLTIPASQPTGSCTLTVTTTFTGGGSETDSVTLTIQSPSYQVSGAQAAQDVNTSRTCTATVTSGQTVALMLLPSANVTVVGGQTRFKDADGTANTADEDATTAKIATVQGTAITPNAQKVPTTTSTGTMTVGITSATSDDVTLVVFANPSGANNALDLVVATGTNPKPAAETVGTGCRTVFVPARAAVGASTPTVGTVNRDLDFFTSAGGTPLTYYYDANDTFQFGGQPLTLATFEGVLSVGDILAVSYAPDPAGTSTFNLTTDTVAAATAVTVAVANTDQGTTINDVQVSFAVPAANGPGTTYLAQRGAVTTLGADGVCGGIDDTAPTTFTDAGTATIGTNQTTGAQEGTFTDLNVANGCYQYRVSSRNAATAQSAASANSSSVIVPAPADVTAPTIADVRAQDLGLAGQSDSGDTHRFIFSEPMAAASAQSGANYAVTDTQATPTTANIVCGATNCSLNTSAVTIGATTYAAGRVLTVTVPVGAGTGGDNVLQYPLTITALSSQIRDLAGNAVDLTGSADKIVDVAAFTGP